MQERVVACTAIPRDSSQGVRVSKDERAGWPGHKGGRRNRGHRGGPAGGAAVVIIGLALALAACTTTPQASGVAASAGGGPAATLLPASIDPATGFAFAADDIAAYYQGQGYTCHPVEPSTTAAGFSFRSCDKVDAAGRELVIGLVTDPGGRMAEGFATVTGTPSEAVLEPEAALPSLAGFLGATLGEDEGGRAADWLTDHLGGVYEQTTLGRVTLATYNGDNDNPQVLAVELANQAYLDAPTPSG
jgi:hypothetical protein